MQKIAYLRSHGADEVAQFAHIMHTRAHTQGKHPQSLLNYTLYRREMGIPLPIDPTLADMDEGSPGFHPYSITFADIHSTMKAHVRWEQKNRRSNLHAVAAERRRWSDIPADLPPWTTDEDRAYAEKQDEEYREYERQREK